VEKFEIRNSKLEARFPDARLKTNSSRDDGAKSFEFRISNFEFFILICASLEGMGRIGAGALEWLHIG
jgi:hypothetical protein